MLLNLESRKSESGEYVVCRTAFLCWLRVQGSYLHTCTISLLFLSGGERFALSTTTHKAFGVWDIRTGLAPGLG